jgi:hypothetical protein
MKRLLLLALGLALSGSASAQTVYIDYDKNFDRSTVKTFAWAETEGSVEKVDPLLHSRIVNGIEHYLSQAGMAEVDGDPDVYVTYHTSSKEEVSISSTSVGYGYPGGWVYGGYYGAYGYGSVGMTSATVSTYQVGTLVVDIWDAKSKNLVWRGLAGDVTISQNPEKMAKRLDKALAKLAGKWAKVKEKEAKPVKAKS